MDNINATDCFRITLEVANLQQGAVLRISLREYIACTWKYRKIVLLGNNILFAVALLRKLNYDNPK